MRYVITRTSVPRLTGFDTFFSDFFGDTSTAKIPPVDIFETDNAYTIEAEIAGYSENDTVYVNAHGTGTPKNDSIETIAIKKALGEEAARRAYVSSTKSMTGHMLGAAGAIEALACLFALNEGVIPPTINLKEQDEECDLNCVPNTAVKADIDLALSNSLGFGGHNASIIIKRYQDGI